MIFTRYFAITPKTELQNLLSKVSIPAESAYPELFSRKSSDRHRSSLDEDREAVIRAFLATFSRRINDLGCSDSHLESLLLDCSAPARFTNYWSITVFEDCEDVDDVLKDLQAIAS